MSVSAKPLQDSEPDELVANKKAAEECGVCVKTTDRWDENSSIGYPPPIFIYTRIYRSRRLLERWKSKLLANAIKNARVK